MEKVYIKLSVVTIVVILIWGATISIETPSQPKKAVMETEARLLQEYHKANPPVTFPEDIDAGLFPLTDVDREELAECWAYYKEDPSRQQDTLCEMYEAYIQRVPDTPFKAEMYIVIARSYGQHANIDIGEERNGQKNFEYYAKAVEAFDGKYSESMMGAWGTLANGMNDVEVIKAFYQWILDIGELDVDEIHDIRPISHFLVRKNLPMRLGDEYVQENLEKYRKGFKSHVGMAITNMALASSMSQLLELAQTFPDTPLADECATLFEKHRSIKEQQSNIELYEEVEL